MDGFLSTPSARRATIPVARVFLGGLDFYPRPPRGGRHQRTAESTKSRNFYPRPPRGGRLDFLDRQCKHLLFLSTPSARRATKCAKPKSGMDEDFYPRPPRGGRRRKILHRHGISQISIHALREEGDSDDLDHINSFVVFLSTPSARRATGNGQTPKGVDGRFLSTPSARRATAKTETKSLFSNKLYNILHEFRRALIYNGSKSYPNHAK